MRHATQPPTRTYTHQGDNQAGLEHGHPRYKYVPDYTFVFPQEATKIQFKAPRNNLLFSHTSLILRRQIWLYFQGQARASQGTKTPIRREEQEYLFSKPAYQKLSLDIKAPSQDLANTLPRIF